jgi:hypothetical protein
VDYGATPLDCNDALWTGLDSFVGGVSDGTIGAAAMRYLNPRTKAFSWQKAWFFLDDDTQYVMIANLSSYTNAPVYSVLDQRRHSATIFVDNYPFNTPGNQTFNEGIESLWHGGVGYVFGPGPMTLSVSVGERTGAWSAIGTSTQPPETVDLFAAWIEHQNLTQPVSYATFPGTTFESFQSKSNSRKITPFQNDAHISAIFDEDYDTVSAVFWDAPGGTLPLQNVPLGYGPAYITVSGSVALILNLKTGSLTVADPSQTLDSVEIQVNLGLTGTPWIRTLNLPLSSGGLAGSSVTQYLI